MSGAYVGRFGAESSRAIRLRRLTRVSAVAGLGPLDRVTTSRGNYANLIARAPIQAVRAAWEAAYQRNAASCNAPQSECRGAFLRRYLTRCARRRRFAQMQGPARLFRDVRKMAAGRS